MDRQPKIYNIEDWMLETYWNIFVVVQTDKIMMM